MTRVLSIDEVFAEKFGGLEDLRVRFGGPGFVVLYGANEAGKSTIATLLGWLLVGPNGTNEEARRFGQPSDQLSGRLSGMFDGQSLRIDGRFEIPKSGVPNSKNVKVALGERAVTIGEWSSNLGGIDNKVYRAIYRMWGGDLHANDSVLAEVAQAALSGMRHGPRVSEVLKELDENFKSVISSGKKGSRTWKTLQAEDKLIENEISNAGRNAEEFVELSNRAEEIRANLEELRRTMEANSARLGSLRTLAEVGVEREEEKAASDELSALEVVPVVWQCVVDQVDELDRLVTDLERKEGEFETLGRSLRARALSSSLTEGQALNVRVTPAQVGTVSRLDAQLKAARISLSHSNSELERAREDQASSEALNRLAANDLSAAGLTGDDLVLPTEAEESAVRGLLANWRSAREACETSENQLSAQVARVQALEASLNVAEDVWARFEVGEQAEPWLVKPVTISNQQLGPVSSRRVAVGVASLGTMVIASAFLLPRFAAGFVVTSCLIGFAWLWVRQQARAAAGSIGGLTSEAASQLKTAAIAVMEAKGAVNAQRPEVARLEAEHQSKKTLERSAMESVAAEFRRFGVHIDPAIEAFDGLLGRLSNFRESSLDLAEAQRKTAKCNGEVVSLRQQHDDLASELATLLESCGVPGELDPDFASERIDELHQISMTGDAFRSLGGELDQIKMRYDQIVSQVPEPDIERGRDHVLAEVRRLVELHNRRTALEAERGRLNDAINYRFRTDQGAKALSQQGFSREAIQEEIETLEKQGQSDAGLVEQLNQDLGQILNESKRLASEDRIAGLRLELGAIRELADDQLLHGAVYAIAHSILAQTAKERRISRQPELVSRASSLLARVADRWESILIDWEGDGVPVTTVVGKTGRELQSNRLSTGAGALTHLALLLATIQSDSERRQVHFPIVCDDPLVHFDDSRARLVMSLFAEVSERGHQVILFTCHERTVEAGRLAGARIVTLST